MSYYDSTTVIPAVSNVCEIINRGITGSQTPPGFFANSCGFSNVEEVTIILFKYLLAHLPRSVCLQNVPANANVPAMAADNVIPNSACPIITPKSTPGNTITNRTAAATTPRPTFESSGRRSIAFSWPLAPSEGHEPISEV